MENQHLTQDIRELLLASIRAYNLNENDAVNLRTLKLMLVGHVVQGVRLDWEYLMGLFRTHIPIHPKMSKELEMLEEDDIGNLLAQIFIRTKKVVNMVKTGVQQGLDMNRILAVDGLGGNIANGPNFEHKLYVENLKYGNVGDEKFVFDTDPEYKRLHAQVVRQLYLKLNRTPKPAQQVYEIVRRALLEGVQMTLPEIELQKEDRMDKKLQKECVTLYLESMGKANMESLTKTLKRSRGEKRAHPDREVEEPASDEKK